MVYRNCDRRKELDATEAVWVRWTEANQPDILMIEQTGPFRQIEIAVE